MLTGVASRRNAALDRCLHSSGNLGQCLPALAAVDNQPKLCQVSWRSAYWRWIHLKSGHGSVPARRLGRACSPSTYTTSCRQPTLGTYLHIYPGKLAHRSPAALTPVDKQTRTCICTHTQASWCSACWRCLPLKIGARCVMRAGAVPPGVTSCRIRRQPCTCTHPSVSLFTACQRCLLSTTGPGRVPPRIPGKLAQRIPALTPNEKQI